MDDVIRGDTKKEISAPPICCYRSRRDNGCHKAQISVVLCYVAKSEVACEVKEAFLGFDDVSNDRRAAAF